MKKSCEFRVVSIFALFALFALFTFTAWGASAPKIIHWQGNLRDSGGGVLNSSNFNFTFRLFDALTNGNQLWTESYINQTVNNSLYEFDLGSVTSIPETAFETDPLYLEIRVSTATDPLQTLTPRVRMLSSPFSIHSLWSERLRTDGAVSTFTSAGHLQIPGGISLAGAGTPAAGQSRFGPSANQSLSAIQAEFLTSGVSTTLHAHNYITNQSNLHADTRFFVSSGSVDTDLYVYGKVGIGIGNPSGKLHVIGGDVHIGTASAHDFSPLEDLFLSGNLIVDGKIIQHQGSQSSFATLAIATNTDSGQIFKVSTGVITATTEGRVGIGTAAPLTKLSVVGQATFGSAAFVPPGLEYLSTRGTASGISMDDRDGLSSRWSVYPNVNLLRFWQSGDKMVLSGAGNLGLATSDTTEGGIVDSRLTLRQEDGKAGIGIMSDSGARRFAVYPAGDGSFTLYDGAGFAWNAGLNQFRGNVGIGTTGAIYRLQVEGGIWSASTVTAAGLVVSTATFAPGAAPTGAAGMIYFDNALNRLRLYTQNAWVDISTQPAGSSAPHAATHAQGGSDALSASFIANANSLQSGTTIYVASASVAGQTVLAAASGNVGIGISNPQAKLHIGGADPIFRLGQHTNCALATPGAVGELCAQNSATQPIWIATSTAAHGFAPLTLGAE